MARPQPSPILTQLRKAKTLHEQTAALRVLKNEIVGHLQKKEYWIKQGVLQPIVRTLSAYQSLKGPATQSTSQSLSAEDAVKLQALQLVGSFANGGAAFLPPLHAANVLPAVLSNLDSASNPPRIVVAALRALTDIADASSLLSDAMPLEFPDLADSLFKPSHIKSLSSMLAHCSTKPLMQTQTKLAAGLISRLCRKKRYQNQLTSAGLLDILAGRLASFAVAEGFVVPGAEVLASKDGVSEAFPVSAPPGTDIAPIIEAISAIIGSSPYRAYRFSNAPAILAVFPPVRIDVRKASEVRDEHTTITSGRCAPYGLSTMGYVLPVPKPPVSVSFGSHSFGMGNGDCNPQAQGATDRSDNILAWSSPNIAVYAHYGSIEMEILRSPLFPWLVALIRSRADNVRGAAVSILTTLMKFRPEAEGQTTREMSMAPLVLPVLVDLISRNITPSHANDVKLEKCRRKVLECAPGILARLIHDSDYLQRAAFECGAVKVLCRLLKYSYEPVDSLNQPRYWSPHPDTQMDLENGSPVNRLGAPGRHPDIAHHIRTRESALKAIAALAEGREEYRKALLSEDVVPYVVESLSEAPRKPGPWKDKSKDKPASEALDRQNETAYGTNPAAVIIAACHVIRVISRSVAVLRTALVDHKIAQPILKFMEHPDVNIQLGATAAIINMVVEVSPLRDLLTELGIMRVLCTHAHSDNANMRLNAMWALKHFVDGVSPALKKACLDELESGWLVQLICDDTEDSALYARLSSKVGDDGADEDLDLPPAVETFRWLYARDGIVEELNATDITRLRQAEDALSGMRDAEVNPVRRARNDDVAVQEQGLDFIRNLIGRPVQTASIDSPIEITEMIDHLLSILGQDRLFEILASKLRPKVLHPFSRRTPVPGREPRTLYPSGRIVTAVTYILVHIAASIPRHRQLVIAQTELLKLLAQQASSRDREVKVALCHLVINLTWQEDAAEAPACAERVRELKKLGYLAKMETLRNSDRDLDVRERAKTAVYQISEVPAAY